MTEPTVSAISGVPVENPSSLVFRIINQSTMQGIIDSFIGAIACGIFGYYFVKLAGQGDIKVIPLECWPVATFCLLIGLLVGLFTRSLVRRSLLIDQTAQVFVVAVLVSFYLSVYYKPMGTAGEFVAAPLSGLDTFLIALGSIASPLMMVTLIRMFTWKMKLPR